MKKVLMLSYFFPPLGAPGSIRTLKFAKYLTYFGWEPIIITTKDIDFLSKDLTLACELPENTMVYRVGGFEPARISYLIRNKLLSCNKGSSNQASGVYKLVSRKWRNRLNSWLFIPEDKAGWIPFVVYKALNIIKKEKPDIIFSTATPFSSHIAGLILKRITGLPLVLDFRDAWTQNPYYYRPTILHSKLENMMEKNVVNNADAIISVTKPILDALKHKYTFSDGKSFVITNGYDEEDFSNLNKDLKFDKFTITYTGNFYLKRNPNSFFEALKIFLSKNSDVRNNIQVLFLGAVNNEYVKMSQKMGLSDVVTFKGYSSHNDAISYICASDMLLLIMGDGEESKTGLTSKIFEYLRAGKSILGIIGEGEALNLLKEKGGAFITKPSDVEEIAKAIENGYYNWKRGIKFVPSDGEEFSRRALTEKLAAIFEKVSDNGKYKSI